MTASGISSQNLFHGGLSVECEWFSHGLYLLRLNLVTLKERCRRICVALQNRFQIHPEIVDGTMSRLCTGLNDTKRRRLCSLQGSLQWTFLGRILVPILGTGVGLQPCHCSNDAFRPLAQYLRLWYEWQVRCSWACSKAWLLPQRLLEVSAMRKTVFHISRWSDVWSNGGFVNADKTKATFHSGNDVDGARSISIFRSSDFSAGFLPTSAPEVAWIVLAIAIW